MIVTQRRVDAVSQQDDVIDTSDLHALNLDKAEAVNRWLATLGEIKPSATRALGAELSDLYAGAVRYQRLLDALLATPQDERIRASTLLVETAVELRHLAWHIRSCAGRLDRLAGDLNPDDEA